MHEKTAEDSHLSKYDLGLRVQCSWLRRLTSTSSGFPAGASLAMASRGAPRFSSLQKKSLPMNAPFLGVDFGTSNSTIGFSDAAGARLLALEGGQTTLPSAMFFPFDGADARFG